MSSSGSTTDYERLTTRLKTQGLDDTAVAGSRTVTVGVGIDAIDDGETASEFVTRLPRLVEDSDDTAQPLSELELKGTLGTGGMGHVHLAEQLSLGREVAVKQVRHRSRSDKATLVLLREGWTTGVLEHPNIVPVHAMGRDSEGEPLIVMKKISGTSWLDIIQGDEPPPEGFDTDDDIEFHVEVLSQICNAVHYAHSQGIVHRDLKPENVMLGEFGEVYVLDWGIAVSVADEDDGRLANAADVDEPVGTPAYMAPEMIDVDEGGIGPHTDIFLLGAMLYEVLAGEPPYTEETLFQMMFAAHRCDPPAFDDSTPPELAAICRKAMARDPEKRFESARAFRQALHNFRSNREARRLAEQGESRLRELRELMDAETEGAQIDERTLYNVFSQCRFAFEQSLEINDDQDRALRGLQTALESMADRELRQKAHKAASLLIADFPQPNDEFSQRLHRLEDELAEREQDLETLRKLKHDVDQDVGRRSRTLFAMAMALFWALFSLAMAIPVEFGFIELSYTKTILHSVVLASIVAAVVYGGRRVFFQNEFNKWMLNAAVAVFVCVVVHRTVGGLAEVPFRTLFSQEMLLYGSATILVGMAMDRRLIWAGLPFLAGAMLGAAFPVVAYWIYVPVNFMAMLIVYLVWGRDTT